MLSSASLFAMVIVAVLVPEVVGLKFTVNVPVLPAAIVVGDTDAEKSVRLELTEEMVKAVEPVFCIVYVLTPAEFPKSVPMVLEIVVEPEGISVSGEPP